MKINDTIILEDVSLKKYNTYKIEAKTKYLIKVKTINALIETLNTLKKANIPYFIIGNGSNIILDDYFKGAVIKLELLNIKVCDKMVKVDAGVMMSTLTMETIKHNLTGLEWAINIPGTIGGSINGNAGAYNSEIFDNLVSLKVLDKNMEIKEINKEDIIYSYRTTDIKDLGYIVLEGTFKLEKGKRSESLEIIKNRCKRRKESQPLDMPTAGSVFRNPPLNHAGKLIEDAGLKGMSIGGAEVSTKHANFIVNKGNATSKDIKSLIELVHNKVLEQFNIDLILEQEIIDWK